MASTKTVLVLALLASLCLGRGGVVEAASGSTSQPYPHHDTDQISWNAFGLAKACTTEVMVQHAGAGTRIMAGFCYCCTQVVGQYKARRQTLTMHGFIVALAACTERGASVELARVVDTFVACLLTRTGNPVA